MRLWDPMTLYGTLIEANAIRPGSTSPGDINLIQCKARDQVLGLLAVKAIERSYSWLSWRKGLGYI